MREVRVRAGMKAKFEATYAGNPRPEFTWTFNGKDLPISENFRTKVRDNSVSLTIYETTMDMTGYYICIAKNDLGTDTTRAGLTVNSKSTLLHQNVKLKFRIFFSRIDSTGQRMNMF